MKKIIFTVLCILVITGTVSAVEGLSISGEIKTGFFWRYWDREGDPQGAQSEARIHNNDDSGPQHGRYRLNFHYDSEFIGMKIR